jgi:hypothetical protein
MIDPPSAPRESDTPPTPAVTPAEPAVEASKLSPEEQMALFEKELKETDWGHQPC